MKNFLKFFFAFKGNINDHQPLTDFLKRNQHFKKAAFKVHDTKEEVKKNMWNSFNNLLKDEDEIKLIEDKSDKRNNTNIKK